jgi:salicylate hydroxylase
VPAEEVRALNPTLLDSVPILCGHRGMINAMPLHFGRTLSLAVVQAPSDHAAQAAKAAETSGDWKAEEVGVQEVADPVLAENFADWTKDARDIVELGVRDPITDWKLADHDPAPTYTKRRIAIVGDAAHATMPFAGQGAGQSLEDGAVLTALFKHVKSLADVEKAFKVYDAVRRPRSQKIVELSREYGRVYAFMHPEVGDDLDKIRMKMYEGEMYASGIDIEKQNQEAVDMFLQSQ